MLVAGEAASNVNDNQRTYYLSVCWLADEVEPFQLFSMAAKAAYCKSGLTLQNNKYNKREKYVNGHQ